MKKYFYIYKFTLHRVHVRRADKINKDAGFHALEEYMIHVEEYYKLKELSGQIKKKRIYLATDEPNLFAEAKRKYVKSDFNPLSAHSSNLSNHIRYLVVKRF
jgi:glycoprotein 6-alpha-L-fucosyltransferase